MVDAMLLGDLENVMNEETWCTPVLTQNRLKRWPFSLLNQACRVQSETQLVDSFRDNASGRQVNGNGSVESSEAKPAQTMSQTSDIQQMYEEQAAKTTTTGRAALHKVAWKEIPARDDGSCECNDSPSTVMGNHAQTNDSIMIRFRAVQALYWSRWNVSRRTPHCRYGQINIHEHSNLMDCQPKRRKKGPPTQRAIMTKAFTG